MRISRARAVLSIRSVPALLLALVLVAAGCATDDEAGQPPTTTTSPTTAPAPPETTAPGHDNLPEPPGSVLASEVIDSGDLPGTVHRITYRSQAVTGEAIAVSGLVAVPDAAPPPGGHPVLAWAHGTTGIADHCAPSRNGVDAVPLLQQHLEAGYVVAATDYEGLGTPDVPHPYLVSESEARGVLDSVRATRELVGVDVASERVVVLGHSQGGHAALAAAAFAADWAPELDLVGTAALAPVTDLEQLIPALFESTQGLVLGVYVAAGWPAAHPELEPADLLTPTGLEVLERAQEVCVFEMGSLLGDHDLDALRVRSPTELPAWVARIQDNTIHADRVERPVLIAQGGRDTVIPPRFVDTTVEDLCAAGAPVRYVFDADDDHVTVLSGSMPEVHRWFDRLLAGEAPPDDCPDR